MVANSTRDVRMINRYQDVDIYNLETLESFYKNGNLLLINMI